VIAAATAVFASWWRQPLQNFRSTYGADKDLEHTHTVTRKKKEKKQEEIMPDKKSPSIIWFEAA